MLDLPVTWEDSVAHHRRSQKTLHEWLDRWQRPIGLASTTDDVTRVVMQMCLARGWRIPEDVAVIGTRNEERLCERPRPSMSSVEIGFERVGYEAARLLDDLMTQAERERRRNSQRRSLRRSTSLAAPPRHVILPPMGVVVRESTSAFLVPDPLVAKAQAFIAANSHRRIGVKSVAAELAVSSKTLQNHFAASLNRTVAEEIRRVKIELVKRELTDGKRSIQEIAALAGFKSNSGLSIVFRREVGLSPSQYRRQRSLPGCA